MAEKIRKQELKLAELDAKIAAAEAANTAPVPPPVLTANQKKDLANWEKELANYKAKGKTKEAAQTQAKIDKLTQPPARKLIDVSHYKLERDKIALEVGIKKNALPTLWGEAPVDVQNESQKQWEDALNAYESKNGQTFGAVAAPERTADPAPFAGSAKAAPSASAKDSSGSSAGLLLILAGVAGLIGLAFTRKK